ncbi:MAG: Coenzyme F420 hydrogenase/dehydrogenase, beta subunit C-terminal domain [Bacteroides sp.]|nr:Coenzyme F420 hydrogenase/dehydrogenase, beta subunit C-terminal domain [Bacteroides sp.]MCM1549026.1 Coenzyme F420 hydrogenase/dehydrogenase, beta subunit C-terminal domain [Clostridium sp.]
MICEECVGCSACKNICPVDCIEMMYNEEGYFVPFIDETKCIHCDACKKVCPMQEAYQPDKEMQQAYLFIHCQEYYRNLSSSGGFFKALSDVVLEDNGVVFGAYLTEDFLVRHGYVEQKEDIFRLMGSKYVQSEMGDSYKQAKEFLEQGRWVLFSGTPCQIGGLYSFLGKEYDNLTTVELFCAGIPSQYSWKSYLKDYHGNEEIRYVQFRYKGQGWWQTGLRFQYLKDDYYFSSRSRLDPYMAAFSNTVNLNETCYHCKFKGEKKNADFSIGDAWNINRIRVNMDDDRGITIVLINSEKGLKIIKKIQRDNHLFEVSLEEAMFAREEWNPNVNVPDNRESFIYDLKEHGFKYAFENNVSRKKNDIH